MSRLARHFSPENEHLDQISIEDVPVLEEPEERKTPGKEPPLNSDSFTLMTDPLDPEHGTSVMHLYVRGIQGIYPQDDVIFHRLMQAHNDAYMNVYINSRGGVISTGLRLINMMQSNFQGRCTTVLQSDALSMGALTFANGDRRIVHPMTSFMFHDYSTFAWGTGGSIENRLRHNRWQFDQLMDNILKNNWLTQDEYQSMIDGKDIYLTTDDMLDRGLATHIRVGRELLSREGYMAYTRDNDRTGLEAITCKLLDNMA